MGRVSEFLINFKYAFRIDKPILIWRLAKAVVQSYVLNDPPLRYVDCAVDFGCNLKCQHCFAVSLKQEGRRTLTVDEYKDIAKQCMRLGTVNFSFQGGEPLLCKNLPEIIHVFQPWRNVISVTTNGTLLNEERVKELKKMGVDILTISLDSSIAEEHDRFRGVPGSFDKTLNGIKVALTNGIRVTLGCVVTHQTVKSEGILGLVDLAKRLKTVLYLILPVPAGRWEGQRQVLLDEKDVSYIENLTRRSPYIRTDFQANLGGFGCGAVKEILYITPYGDVLPCPFLHISLGNVLEERLSVIRQRALKNRYFTHYHDKCLASTDPLFMEKYLSNINRTAPVPVTWDTLFEKEIYS